MAEDKNLDLKIKNILKEILYKDKNTIFKLKNISIMIQNKIDKEVNIKKIELKLKNIKYAPKNCQIKKIGGFFYVYHEDEEQKKLTYEVNQKIFLNMLKECSMGNDNKLHIKNKHLLFYGIDIKKISEQIDFITISKFFMDDLKKTHENKEKFKKMYYDLKMHILFPLAIHDNTDNNLYETIKREDQKLYELSIKSLNYNYIKSKKDSYFNDQIFKEDPDVAVKKVLKNAAISAFVSLGMIAFTPKLFVILAMYLAIPLYCMFSGGLKKGFSRLILSYLIYIAISSNNWIETNISLLNNLPETWIPDINIFIIAFIFTNITLNYSHYFIKLFNSSLFILNAIIFKLTANNLDFKIDKINNYWKKIDIEIQKNIKKFFQGNTNENDVSLVKNSFNIFNINIPEYLFEKNPFASISLVRYFCTTSLITLLYITVFHGGIIKNTVIKNYTIENNKFCQNDNMNEKSLIVKLKGDNGKVFLYDGEKFNKITCEN